jgi:hypothetical protein
MSSCFEWGPWENNGSALASELKHSYQDSWCTHFTWNSYTPVYCSLRTIVFWLVTYSSVFVETSGAHTLLWTVIQLLNPASVHMFTDKSAGDLLWTSPRVVWEHPYSDQWERAIITRLISVDQSQGQEGGRERILTWRKPLYFVERL